jgi:hypothetical protein
MLSIDVLIASGVILQFVGDFNTAAYAVFAYIIAEAAILLAGTQNRPGMGRSKPAT